MPPARYEFKFASKPDPCATGILWNNVRARHRRAKAHHQDVSAGDCCAGQRPRALNHNLSGKRTGCRI